MGWDGKSWTRPRLDRAALTVAGIYLAAAVGWILVSDRIVLGVASTTEDTATLQTVKGLAFVAFSAGLIFFLVRRTLRRQQDAQRERDAVLDAVNDGVWTYDGALRQGRSNARLCELLGDEGPVVDTSWGAWHERVHPADRAAVHAAIAAMERDETDVYDNVHRVARSDGTWIWVRSRGRVLERGADGAPLRTVGTYTDVTPLKEKEEALLRMVRELTLSRAEIERFSYAVAHDLREPVRTVGSYAGLLRRRHGGDLTGEAGEYLQYVAEGARRLDGTLKRLLEVFEHREATAPFTAVDLNVVVREAAEKLADAVARSAALLEIGWLPVVRGDPVQLALLMENLLGNALKFRDPARPPQIAVSARRDGDAWAVTVADNGVGFPSQHTETVFQAFHSAHSRADYPGAGMGLAICRAIVERHGGSIRAESAPHAGTRVAFTLPANTAASASADTAAKA